MEPHVQEISLPDFRDSRVYFMQSRLWARQKAAHGQIPRCFRVTGPKNDPGFDLLVLLRRVGPFTLAYIPHGPDLHELCSLFDKTLEEDPDPARGADGSKPLVFQGLRILESLGRKLASHLHPRPYALRFDPPWELPEDLRRDGLGAKLGRLRRGPADIQVPDTVLVDLTAPEDEILGRMKSKTRYNTRLAEKKGVQVARHGLDGLKSWYEIYQITARRDRIGIHSYDYYHSLMAENPHELDLWLASHEGEVLAGILVLHHGSRSTYLYGASSDTKRNLMPAYGLQWQAMASSKARGSRDYDLFGIPPDDNPAHPMHGLYQIKTGFGGREVHRPGTLELVVRPVVNLVLSWMEACNFFVRRRLSKVLRR